MGAAFRGSDPGSGRVTLRFFEQKGVFSTVAHDPKDEAAPAVAEDPQLGSLEVRLAAARKAETERLARDRGPVREGSAVGFQIASTMLGYPLGGIVIGWVLDGLFGTRPWVMIGLMFTAFVAACLQIVRSGKLRADPAPGRED